jgi:hypothetical protein
MTSKVDVQVLKPCPLCGGEAVIIDNREAGTGASGMETPEPSIRCTKCKLETARVRCTDWPYGRASKMLTYKQARESIITAWNTRIEAQTISPATAVSVRWHRPVHRAVMASVKLGAWMSAALDDPSVCDAMKADINEWFSAGEPMETLCQALGLASAAPELLEASQAWETAEDARNALRSSSDEHERSADEMVRKQQEPSAELMRLREACVKGELGPEMVPVPMKEYDLWQTCQQLADSELVLKIEVETLKSELATARHRIEAQTISPATAEERDEQLRKALEPFAAMGRVMEKRAAITFGHMPKDTEIVCESSGEAGMGILTMGHFRDAAALLPDAPGWGGMYQPLFDRARPSASTDGDG